MNKNTQDLFNTAKTYRYGIVTGLGTFTGIGIMAYIFYPTISKTSTNTATKVLTSEQVYKNASDLTKNITSDLLKDEATYIMLCALCIQVLKNENVRREFVEMLHLTMEDPYAHKVTKEFAIRLMRDPEIINALSDLLSKSASNVIDQEEFQVKVSKSLKIAIKKMFW